MKLMIATGLGVGEVPSIGIPSRDVMAWQRERIESLGAAIENARQKGAEACLLAGGVLADGFVSQSLVQGVVETLSQSGIPVTYVPFMHEGEGIEGRVDVSALGLVRMGQEHMLEVPVGGADACIKTCFQEVSALDDRESRSVHGLLTVLRDDHDVTVGLPDGSFVQMGPLEPSSFADRASSGYLLIDFDGSSNTNHQWIPIARHPFVVRKVELEGLSNTRELVTLVGNAVKDVSRSACLRIELKGKIPLDVYINTDELAAQLGRFFTYVEIVDFCSLDLDVAALDTDVSLLGEFVRQVSEDDSLSEREKTRILRCGWNALNGKELAE